MTRCKNASSSKVISLSLLLLLIAMLNLVTQASSYIFASCEDFVVQSAEKAPSDLNLDLTFYKKYVDVDGLAVLGSDIVSDEALLVAARLTKMMASSRPDLHSALIEDKVRIAIMAQTEKTTDVPEHAGLDDLNGARGLGATRWRLASSGAEENLLDLDGDPYAGENIFVHELAHTYLGRYLDATRPVTTGSAESLEDVALSGYTDSINDGLWSNTYAATNVDEWFAEGLQSWFNANWEGPSGGNGVHNNINTRCELKTYDKRLYCLIGGVFPVLDQKLPTSCDAADGNVDQCDEGGCDATCTSLFSFLCK
jgi:hypothetical protein